MLILPIGTNRGCRSFPYVTVGLIVINTLVLMLEFASSDPMAILRWGFTPAHPSLLTILTSVFMHAGLVHLLGNMLFLWVFGSVVEDALGHLVYGLFYVGGGLAAALMHWFITLTMDPRGAMVPCVGASGAVAAILAIFAVRFYRNQVRLFYIFWLFVFIRWGTFAAPSLWAVGVWFGLELISGFRTLGGGPGVAHWAHVGGFLFGILMGFALRSPQDAAQEYGVEDARESLVSLSPHRAVEQLLPIVRAHPENDEAREQLARAYDAVGNEPAADDQWRCLLRQRLLRHQRAEVVEICRQLPRRSFLDGFDERTLYDVACCFEESFQFGAAVQLLQRVWQGHPMAPEAELAMLRQATLLKEKLRDPGADALFDHFLNVYPNSPYRTYALAKRSGGG